MQPILSTATWLELSEETRGKLRDLFAIPKTGGREVYGKRLVSDGTTPENLKALSLEKMQEFLGGTIEPDFHLLFRTVVNKIENPELAEEVRERAPKKTPKKTTKKKTNAKTKKGK